MSSRLCIYPRLKYLRISRFGNMIRMGVDHIDVYRPARTDPQVPIEDTIGAISDLVKAGYVRQIGLSEVEAGDDPPRPHRASDLGPADLVLVDEPRRAEGDFPAAEGAWHRGYSVQRALARVAERHSSAGREGDSAPICRGYRRKPRTQPKARRGARGSSRKDARRLRSSRSPGASSGLEHHPRSSARASARSSRKRWARSRSSSPPTI